MVFGFNFQTLMIMKIKYSVIFFLFLLLVSQSQSFAQSDSLGMLGDQLDLYGVLDLFKNSDNLEEFEKKLNSEDNEVNNLDLNNDDKIDYIRVVDYKEGNGHAIVLQVPISASESQDVAVIEVDQAADKVAHIQIVGDDDLYGKNYIVEPLDDNQSTTITNNTIVVVNTWSWRPVRYFYGPSYRAWVSPWRWSYYPGWFRPWRPVGWYAYHPRVLRYRPYARVVVVRRSPRIYTAVYAPRRVTSKVIITNRTRPNYYSPSPTPKTNIGGSGVNQERQNNKQGKENDNPGGDNNANTGNNTTGNSEKAVQDKRQENNQKVNSTKEQRNTKKQYSTDANSSKGGGKHKRGGESRGGNNKHQGGGGGREKRGK